jgi:hypothetical protein
MKQFWLNEGAYKTYIEAAEGRFANGFKLEIRVPKSFIGNGKTLNTANQADEFLFAPLGTNSADALSQEALDKINSKIKSIKISKEK